ncbi:MAG TPA: hypothetical protein VFI15_07060 [Candidatus Limnocylindrales bacterium]|nr:hypothetical protein [Candidatus Limnocylindrales bacterium]
MTLSPRDRAAIQAVPLDPDATIAFHEILGCLGWSDEVPDDLTNDGHAYLRDLLAIRGAIHRGEPADLEPWNIARMTGLRWNGFDRLVLTPRQQALLAHHLADDTEL